LSCKVLKGERIFQHFFLLYDSLTCVEQSHIHYTLGGFGKRAGPQGKHPAKHIKNAYNEENTGITAA